MGEEDREKPVMEKKKVDKQGKKPHKNKPLGKKYVHYKVSGNDIKKDKVCARCGPGVFLANHGNRLSCGKCSYTEFVNAK